MGVVEILHHAANRQFRLRLKTQQPNPARQASHVHCSTGGYPTGGYPTVGYPTRDYPTREVIQQEAQGRNLSLRGLPHRSKSIASYTTGIRPSRIPNTPHSSFWCLWAWQWWSCWHYPRNVEKNGKKTKEAGHLPPTTQSQELNRGGALHPGRGVKEGLRIPASGGVVSLDIFHRPVWAACRIFQDHDIVGLGQFLGRLQHGGHKESVEEGYAIPAAVFSQRRTPAMTWKIGRHLHGTGVRGVKGEHVDFFLVFFSSGRVHGAAASSRKTNRLL